MTSLMMSLKLDPSKCIFKCFTAPDPEIWDEGGNRGDKVKHNIETENNYRPFMMTSLFFSGMFQIDKYLFF